MEELINKLTGINKLSELDISNINTNDLLCAIVKSNRYDLLKDSNLRLNINDKKSLEELVDFLLSDEDILYYMHQNGYYFSKDEIGKMFDIVFKKHHFSYEFENFFRDFFGSKEEVNMFIKDHAELFEKYIQEKGESISYTLKGYDSFVELVLKGDNPKLISNIESYSLSNLKNLSNFTKRNNEISSYIGNDRYVQHLFKYKNSLEPDEFCELLSLLKDKSVYDRKVSNSEFTSFMTIISDNIDYLIDVASKTKSVPKCLAESTLFRDECIKRNRIDLAIQCLLPSDIMQNEALMSAYCKELGIDEKDFNDRCKWLLNYQKKNNNIYNTLLASSLKDGVFNLNEEHFERFINDINIQVLISKLNKNELKVLSRILDIYDYKDFEISSMIVNILKNMNNYSELINGLNVDNLEEKDIRNIVSVLQHQNNTCQIKDLNSLRQYDELKKKYFENNYASSDLDTNKENLLKALFNIDLKEAQYIDYKYCYDNDNNNVLATLRDSELQPEIFDYLATINKIVECDDKKYLQDLYNYLKESKVYDKEIPLEVYLRSKYTELYSKSLYRIDERNQVYGPKDSISNEVNYNGKNVKVCIPRENFNMFVHCVGSCSIASDVIDSNYKVDWLDRPRIQDHFVACSYINEKGIYSIRSQGSIIFGFDTLESGSILGMGNTDIDSIGSYSSTYDGSRELQEGNGGRARYFVPSEILKTINNGYNEIVVERRNMDKSKDNNFKRKPDYIIMMAESMDQTNFNNLETLYKQELKFVSDEDKKEIEKIGNPRKLKEFLAKYKEIIYENARVMGITPNEMANYYVNLIMKSKYYEDCLKAASEFDIPLVVVDKTHYFHKLLLESGLYNEEKINEILEQYAKSDEFIKRNMYNMIAKGEDVSQVLKPKETNNLRIYL